MNFGGTEEALDSQNRLMTENLSQKISTLKHFAYDIDEEAKENNRLLDTMNSDVYSTKGFLSGSFGRVNKMIGNGRSQRRVMCYTSLGVVLAFIFIYYLVVNYNRTLTT